MLAISGSQLQVQTFGPGTNTIPGSGALLTAEGVQVAGRFGAGMGACVNPRINLYSEYDFSAGDKVSEPWVVNPGFRWQR